MKRIRFNAEKSSKLKQIRGVDFNDIIRAINRGHLVKIITHHNNFKYPNQRIFLVNINTYIFCVQFVEEDAHIFLKTLFPSRKYTKEYYHLFQKDEKK